MFFHRSILLCLCVGVLCVIGPSQASSAEDDAPTTRSVTLRPVVRKGPEPVTLAPVRKGEAPGPTQAIAGTSRMRPQFKPSEPVAPSASATPRQTATSPMLKTPAMPPLKMRIEPEPLGPPEEPIILSPPESAPIEVAVESPSGPMFAEALRGAATPKTRALLSQLVARHPDSPHTGDALMRLGEISLALGEFHAARAAYERALTVTTDTTLQVRCRTQAALLDTLSGEAMADAEWAALADDAPTTAPWRAQALLGRALAAELRGDVQCASQTLHTLILDHPSQPSAAWARMRADDLCAPLIAAR